MYKVFIKETPVFLIDNKDLLTQKQLEQLILCENKVTAEMILTKIETDNENRNPVFVYNSDVKSLYHFFFQNYIRIAAAGGLVVNPSGEILFIFRNNKWDLPKGKLERAEHVEKGAIREVEEECGISDLTIQKDLLETFHTYEMGSNNYIKRTCWFTMSHSGEGNLTPQLEEDITDVKWIAADQLEKVYSNTYQSILDVLEAHLT